MARTHRIQPTTTTRAKRLRRETTFPERLLWGRLRAGQLSGVRFRRQYPVGRYIVDFYCAAAQLAIELDGLSHDDQKQYDAERTQFLAERGVRVIRFTNDEVLRDLDDVVWRIACEVGLEPWK